MWPSYRTGVRTNIKLNSQTYDGPDGFEYGFIE
jgi:hypothetical protein